MAEVKNRLEVVLFTPDPQFARQASAAGVDAILIDWERHNKASRQTGYDTQIGTDSPEDARRMAEAVDIPVYVRIDRCRGDVDSEVELALDCGARGIMLPMAQTPQEVEAFVNAVAGRARTIVQLETQSLIQRLPEINSIGWDCAYIGLNDLMISRGAKWLFEPIADGTVESIFRLLAGRRIGFGGITVVGNGMPVPFTSLLREMARLGCSMSFLRRSFHRDIAGRDMAMEMKAVRTTWEACCLRSPEAVRSDHEVFVAQVIGSQPNATSLVQRTTAASL